ncbi:MAG: Asp-tRNA(Asn)/Glu-tRNA(Gln) amidotransferase subunit GatA [Planctomycetota bacterium]
MRERRTAHRRRPRGRHRRRRADRAAAAAQACLDRIAAVDPTMHAFLVDRDRVRRDAEAVDRARAAGAPLAPLAGVPIAWKDNLVRAGHRATAGSRLLETFTSPYTATVLARLERAGAVLLGRTNLDEFGMGSTNENSAYGPTRNPWNPECVPGGSSGGSAAAVAANCCPLAVGSDTGGSIRQPAAFCGVTGLKPTYGRTSRHGLIAYASSLDCIGAVARTAEDLALWLDAVAGPDAADATTLPTDGRDFRAALGTRADLRGLRIGMPAELNGPGLADEVAEVVAAAAAEFGELGAELAPCSMPNLAHAIPTYYLIATAEASSNLARYDGVRYGRRREVPGRIDAMMAATRSAGFGPEVQLRVLLGTFALRDGYHDEYYGQATRVRAQLRADFAAVFANCDVLLSPTAPSLPFPLGSLRDDPLETWLCDALTVPQSLAGLPAISVPCGFAAGLPVGMQLSAPWGREDLLLQIAHVFQQHTDHHLRRAQP